ncbi:MAG: CPBP family intramembrane metalloprotease [Lentisphaerae bacterium]|nr:CPBP family intramembrane metalloprotease [Lentisphaerota bacterium]
MKNSSFNIVSRRIYARAWQIALPVSVLVTGLTGGLCITFGGGVLLGKYMGLIPGMIAASLGAALFIIGVSTFFAPGGNTMDKLGFHRLKKADFRLIFLAFLLITLVSVLITAAWGEILDLFHIPYMKEQGLIQLVKGGDSQTVLQLFLLTAAAVPLAEELMFRRCLYELLLPLGGAAAFIGTALIFSVAHGFLLGMPGLFFMGLIFQFLANTTRNLWSSVLCHAFHNALVIACTCLIS